MKKTEIETKGEIFGTEDERRIIFLKEKGSPDFVFENCKFINCDIICESPYVEFYKCEFQGENKINNKGVGDADEIKIFCLKAKEEMAKDIQISSAIVSLENCEVKKGINLNIEAGELEVLTSDIEAETNIRFYKEITIKDSHFLNLKASTTNIEEITEEVINSKINGQEIGCYPDEKNQNQNSNIKKKKLK